MVNGFTLHHGDCLDVLKTMPDNSVDSIVTDPPYGLSFMGRKWDYDVPSVEIWEECLRVLKPGGHLLAFAGTRTQHRMACRIEDAGFEIRDMIAWLYGSGMPKNLDVSKAVDKHVKSELTDEKLKEFGEYVKESRKAKGFSVSYVDSVVFNGSTRMSFVEGRNNEHGQFKIYLPSKREFKSLKTLLDMDDRFDLWVDSWPEDSERHTLDGGKSDLLYVEETSYGYQNSEKRWDKGSRVTAPATPEAQKWSGYGSALKPSLEPITLARKPLIGTIVENVLTHGTGALNIDGCRTGDPFVSKGGNNFDAWRSGENRKDRPAQHAKTSETEQSGRWPANTIHDGSEEVLDCFPGEGIESPARFFYCPKANKKDRDDGLEGRNTHVTVKPTELMCYLCRLITPPNGTILDPFMGSGSTGRGALLEGFQFIGIEREAEYVEIAKARISAVLKTDDYNWFLGE